MLDCSLYHYSHSRCDFDKLLYQIRITPCFTDVGMLNLGLLAADSATAGLLLQSLK